MMLHKVNNTLALTSDRGVRKKKKREGAEEEKTNEEQSGEVSSRPKVFISRPDSEEQPPFATFSARAKGKEARALAVGTLQIPVKKRETFTLSLLRHFLEFHSCLTQRRPAPAVPKIKTRGSQSSREISKEEEHCLEEALLKKVYTRAKLKKSGGKNCRTRSPQ